MNGLLLSLKKSPSYLAYPFIFISAFLLIVNFLSMFPIEAFERVYVYCEDSVELLFGIASVFFVCCFVSTTKKAIMSALCYAFADSVFFSLSNEHFGLVFAVFFAFAVSAVLSNLDLFYAFLLLLVSGVIIGLFFGFVYEYLFSLLKSFCAFLSKRALLFSFINNAYSLFFSDNLSELIYNKDYSGAVYFNDELVAGIRNIFLADTENPQMNVSLLMTGKYYVNIFVSTGMFAALYSKFNQKQLSALVLTYSLSLLFGDIKLFSLFILLYNPIVYLAFLALSFISYLVPRLLDIRIGFARNGSVIELFRYGQKWIYFIISGLIIAVMAYFLSQLVIARFDLQSRKMLPREVRKIVNALGGEKNIDKLTSDRLYVKNPNLINVLMLDCDIHENEITLHYGDFDLIKDYFQDH